MRFKDIGLTLSVLGVLMVTAACKGDETQQNGAQNARQIELPPVAASQPQLNDAPKPEPAAEKPAPKPAPTPKPKAPEPTTVTVRKIAPPEAAPAAPAAAAATAAAPSATVAAAPAAAEPAFGTIATGTALKVSPAMRICTNTHAVGDRVTATLDESVVGSNGALLPMGSTVMLRVTESGRGKGSEADARIAFEVMSVRVGDTTYQAWGHLAQIASLEKVRAQSTADQAKKIGAGAAIGALAGQLLGKNTKSTVIGAAVGAAAGTAVAAGTADYDACVPQGARFSILLDRAMNVRAVMLK
ncbi:MAG: hypothetical protein NTZ43_01510 [Gemmatimonadetes bacterium]|nr:hypothetical protein [Gemmatimonadota bacterium]